jgi:hypothetical protein
VADVDPGGQYPEPDAPSLGEPAPLSSPFESPAPRVGLPAVRRRIPAVIAGAVGVALLLLAGIAVIAIRVFSAPTTPAVSAQQPGPVMPPNGSPAGSQSGSASPAAVAPSATGLVRLDGPAGSHPEVSRVVDLLERHFAAINARDYEGWANTVTSRRAVDQSPDRWAQSYRSTRDSAVVISSIRETGADSLVIMLSFVSEQDVADTPKDLPAKRICWQSTWPVVALASGPRIDIPARGSTTKQAC